MNATHDGTTPAPKNVPSSTWSARLGKTLAMLPWAGMTALLPQSDRAVRAAAARASFFQAMAPSFSRNDVETGRD